MQCKRLQKRSLSLAKRNGLYKTEFFHVFTWHLNMSDGAIIFRVELRHKCPLWCIHVYLYKTIKLLHVYNEILIFNWNNKKSYFIRNKYLLLCFYFAHKQFVTK